MKKATLTALAAIGLVATGTASATTYYLNQVGLRAGSGTYYSLFYDGSDLNPASTATWDWDGTTLTMTGGFLQANQRIGNAPGGTSLISDYVTGLTINTGTGTTTATSYSCIEGVFGAGTGANQCANTSFGFNGLNDSSVIYNDGGMADCEERIVGGDDASGTPAVFRGLRSWNSTGCNGGVDGNMTGRGALDMIYVMIDSGGQLVLASWNDLAGNGGVGGVNGACLNPGSASAIDPTGFCRRAHWLVLSDTVPVPAAVWMFGSALGVLGAVRRRIKA